MAIKFIWSHSLEMDV